MSDIVIFHDTTPTLGAVELDATMTETHSGDVEVTEHPVERGANIADHFRTKPVQVSLEGLVSNTPVGVNARDAIGNQAARGEGGKAEIAYERLLSMRDSSELVTITTRLRTYTNMKLVSLSVPRDRGTGDALRFSATFREIVIVASERVKIPATPRGKGKTTAGPSQPKPVPEEQSESIWHHANAALFGGDSGSGKNPGSQGSAQKAVSAVMRGHH
jgi:hypothetical protein